MHFDDLVESGGRPELIRMAEYCDRLAGSRTMPRCRDISLCEVLWALGHIFLVDVLRDEDDYLFTLFGDAMKKMYGADFTGLRLGTVGNANLRNLLRATYNAVVATQTPLYLRGKYCWPTQEIDVERLLIPLADDRGHMVTILGVVYTNVPDEFLLQFAGNGPALFVPSDRKKRDKAHSAKKNGRTKTH